MWEEPPYNIRDLIPVGREREGGATVQFQERFSYANGKSYSKVIHRECPASVWKGPISIPLPNSFTGSEQLCEV